MKKMGFRLAMALMIMTLMCIAADSSRHQQDDDGLRLPSQGDVGIGDSSSSKPWSCCDSCRCTRSIPPQCTCQDWLVGGCHPNCKSCVQLPPRINPPFFVCKDVIYELCGEPCHTDPLLN